MTVVAATAGLVVAGGRQVSVGGAERPAGRWPAVPDGRRELQHEPPFAVHTTRSARDDWRVEVVGDLDAFTAPMLAAQCALPVDPPVHAPTQVEIDPSKLSFCDTAGLAALQAVVAGLEASAVQVTVVGARLRTRSLFALAAECRQLAAGPILAAASQPDHRAPTTRPAPRPSTVKTVTRPPTATSPGIRSAPPSYSLRWPTSARTGPLGSATTRSPTSPERSGGRSAPEPSPMRSPSPPTADNNSEIPLAASE